MSIHSPTPTGESFTALVEQVVFSDPDPRVQRLKARWEETQREVQELFEGACREQYEYRLKVRHGEGAADAESLARHDLALIRPMFAEEREQRLWQLWQDIHRQVGEVRQQLRDEKAEASGPEASSTNS